MSIDEILVLIVGTSAIAFVYWFFFMKNVKAVASSGGAIDITVKDGYSPEVVSVPAGEKTTLRFTRKDPSSCLEEVVLYDFRTKKFLPIDETVSIDITPEKTGEYTYACGMNMYHGKIIAK